MTQEQDAKTLQDIIADTVRAVADHLTAHLAIAAVLDALDELLRQGNAKARVLNNETGDETPLTKVRLHTLQGDTGTTHDLRLAFGPDIEVLLAAADFEEKATPYVEREPTKAAEPMATAERPETPAAPTAGPTTTESPPITKLGAICDHGHLARSCELCRMGNDLLVASNLLIRVAASARPYADYMDPEAAEALAEAEEFLRK